jgi:hypothetical protein
MVFEGFYKLHNYSQEVSNRPIYFKINSEIIEPGMSNDDLIDLYNESVEEHVDYAITGVGGNSLAFVEWVRDNKLT